MLRARSYYSLSVVLCSSNARRPASLLLCYNSSVVDTCLSPSLLVSNAQNLHNYHSDSPPSNRKFDVIIIYLFAKGSLSVCQHYIWQLNISGTLSYYQCGFAAMFWMRYWNDSIKWVPCALGSLSERLQNSCFPSEGRLRSWVMTDL